MPAFIDELTADQKSAKHKERQNGLLAEPGKTEQHGDDMRPLLRRQRTELDKSVAASMDQEHHDARQPAQQIKGDKLMPRAVIHYISRLPDAGSKTATIGPCNQVGKALSCWCRDEKG